MAKNEKRITVAEFEKVVKEKCSEALPSIITDEWNGITVTIRPSLPLVDALSFVEEVVDACFTEDGDFMPEVIDVLIKRGILSRYANFNLPIDLRKAYELIYHSDAFEFVTARINSNQITEIVNAISTGIKYRCDSNITEIRRQLNELLTAMADISEKFGNVFDGLSTEDVSGLIKTLSSPGLDEKKLVDAFLSKEREEADLNVDLEHGVSPIKS